MHNPLLVERDHEVLASKWRTFSIRHGATAEEQRMVRNGALALIMDFQAEHACEVSLLPMAIEIQANAFAFEPFLAELEVAMSTLPFAVETFFVEE
jgi:hypothetical protein